MIGFFFFCLRNALWKGAWLTPKLATGLGCLESRHRSVAWRSSSARFGMRRNARRLSMNACWTSRHAWRRRLRPTGACSTEREGERRCVRWACEIKDGGGIRHIRIRTHRKLHPGTSRGWGTSPTLGQCKGERHSFFLPAVGMIMEI